MRPLLLAALTTLALAGCGDDKNNLEEIPGEDTSGSDDTDETGEIVDTADTEDTEDTGDTTDTGETGDSADTGETGDSTDTEESGDTDTDTAPPVDADRDGYSEDEDCDDSDPNTYPDAEERCDGVDNDCDGAIDNNPSDGDTFYADEDGDGYGDPGSVLVACAAPPGYVTNTDDCDDTDASINPDASEVCDGEDNDCDDLVDDDDDSLDASTVSTWYPDSDVDGYGDPDGGVEACSPLLGYTDNDDDCDDSDAEINPAESEVCDGEDNDCDGKTDAADPSLDTSTATTWYKDVDGDDYGSDTSTVACDEPAGYTAASGDCDDAEAEINPSADEVCDSIDNDCDGLADNDPVDGEDYPLDLDEDGLGDPETSVRACDGVDNALDCNDADPKEPQVVDIDATGTSDGSYGAPWTSIQAGIDRAYECVLVFPGTYNEAITYAGRDLAITSIGGSTETTIDATGLNAPVVSVADGETAASLSGFTLVGGSGHVESSSSTRDCGSSTTCTDYTITFCGGGVYVNGSTFSFDHVTVEANTLHAAETTTAGTETYYTSSYGGGLCAMDGDVTVDQATFQENFAVQGGGIYLDEGSVVEVTRSWAIANTADEGGAFLVDGGNLALTNVGSVWNEATASGGGTMLADGTLAATNVLHGEDDAPTGGGLYLYGASSVDLMNSIVYGADVGVGVLAESTAAFAGSYNNVYGNTGGNYSGVTDPSGTSGNISSNPRFNSVTADGDPSNDDWTLRSSSPSVNTGNSDSAYNDADGTRNDMGVYGGPLGDF